MKKIASMFWIFAVCAAIPALFTACGDAKGNAKTNSPVKEEYEFVSKHAGDDTYLTSSTVEETDNAVVGAHVPVTDIPELDAELKIQLAKSIDRFNADVSALEFEPNREGKAVLYADWVSSSWGNKYIAIMVKCATRMPGNDETYSAFSVCYDIDAKKLTSLPNMAVNSTLTPLNTVVMNLMKQNEKYADYLADQTNAEKTQDKLELPSTALTFGADGITLYFDQGTALPARFGMAEIMVPYGELTALLKPECIAGDASAYPAPTSPDSASTSPSTATGDTPPPAGALDPSAGEPVRGTPGLVALTFDDGPKNATTPQLLEILEKYDAKATFFQLGLQLEECPWVAKSIVEKGHEIGLHSYKHQAYSKLSAAEVKSDIEKTQGLLRDATDGYEASIIRTPYGERTAEVLQKVGYPVILWNVDPEDWKYKDAEKVAANVIEYTAAGDIILMHDIYQTSVEAVETILKTLTEKGFKFVTVSELMSQYGVEPVSGSRYCSVYN